MKKPSDSSRRGPEALLEELSPERRQLLARLLEKERAKRSRASIPRAPRGEGALPASDAQRRLWFLWQLDPSDTSYNECLVARLDGPLDPERLKRAVLGLLGRHEVLRSLFEEVNGELVQQVREVSSLELAPIDASELEARTESDRLRDQPFDLSTGPLYRAKLFRVAHESHVLAIALHHIVADGWSQNVFLRELGALYEAYELPPLPIQYGDYAVWQKQELSSERLARGLAFWKEELANAASRDLPYDWTRGSAASGPARALEFPLDEATAAGIGRVGKELGATPFMLVSAAVAGVLARLTGEPDRTFGTPFAGRTRPELEGLIGFFLNLLPIRVNMKGDPSFSELVAVTRDATIRAIQHQAVPFEQIIDSVRPERDLSRTPLFQILVNSPELEAKDLRIGDLRVELLVPETDHAKYELTLYLEPTGERGLRLRAVYRADLFREESIRELGNEIVRCLSRGCLEPDRPVAELVLPRDVAEQVGRRLEGRELPTPVLAGAALIQRRRESRQGRCERRLARAPSFASTVAAWSLVVSRRARVKEAVVGAAIGEGSPLPVIVDVDPGLELGEFMRNVEHELGLLRRLPAIPSWALRARTAGGVQPFDSVVGESIRSPSHPLELTVQAGDEGRLVLQFDDELFDEAEARALLDQVAGVIECFEREPELRLGAVDLARFAAPGLLPDPRVALIRTEHEPVLDRIARIAETTPNAVAIRQHGREHSYAELWLNAHAISERLVKSRIRSQMAVAVCGRQSFELFSAWLAVLQRNAILVTLDPSLPERRGEHMQNAAAVELVLDVDATGGVEIHRCQRQNDRTPASSDAAYVFFTSGTMGLPKGVLGTHAGLSHFLDWQRREFGIGPGHRAAQLTGLSFDVVLRSVFLPLTSGATLCLPADSSELGADSVLSFLSKERISFAHVVPTLTASWLASAHGEIRCVRQLFFAGEPLSDSLVRAARRVFPNAEVVNLYGPTETTLAKCFSRVGAEPRRGAQPVGRPLPCTQALVLRDESSRTAGVGELGEVAIRTPFRTLGYVNAPEETKARFVPNPFRNETDDLLYLTGDRGYFLADGSLALAGRSDDQIKIWGVRVEPAEVARTLRDHPSVDDVFVGAQPDDAGGSRLVAWVATRVPLDPRDLVRFLEPILPVVMIPKTFVLLERLPVNASGKVDRSRLPAPVASLVRAKVAPRTALEEQVASVFAELLAAKSVGAEDDFFQLGGHSLLAVRAANRLSRALGVELSLRKIFEQPSVAGVAASIEALLAEGKRVELLRLVPRNRTGDPLPLSFSEERLWFIDQLEPGKSAYNIHACFRVRGQLRQDALTSAIRSVVDRHESLRTSFPTTAGVPRRRIHEHGDWDAVRISETDEASLVARLRHEVRRPFDLGRGPLLRFVIATLGPEHHVICFVVHHVVADGWSLLLLVRELIDAYSGAPQFPELPIQYADFAAWQRESVDIDDEVSHFEKSLSEIEPLELPLDHPRPAVLGDRGNRVAVALSPALSERARQLASNAGVTPFMLFFALLGVLAGRLSGQKRFAIGFPIAGRTAQETDGVVGFFANTLVAPIDLNGAPSFLGVLQRTKSELLGAYAHQHAPFEKVVAALEPERNTSRSPVFQAVFALAEGFEVPSAPGLELEMFELDAEIARFDLSLVLQDRAVGFSGHLDLNADLFDRETAVAWAEHFPRLLEQALVDPESPVERLDFVDATERNRLLGPLSGSSGMPPRGSLLERITEVARSHPDRIAIVTNERRVDYAELVRTSARLAGRLIEVGVGPERRVAIGIERSLDFVIGMLGVWDAGGAYVPIDPGLPSARRSHMLADSGAVAWLTRERTPELEELGVPIVQIDDEGTGTPGLIEPHHAAYVIYTSGSTGQPKGVVIEHAGVASTIAAMVEAWDIRPGTRVLGLASPSFDASVLETFTALSAGATLFLPNREQAEPGEPLARYVRENDIHFALIVPSVLGVMPHDLALRTLVVGGEASSRALIEPFARRMRVVNAYGPTEVSIAATQGELLPNAEVTIGRPLPRTRVYVLDARLSPVPAGVYGELCVGGAGVGRGYAGMPALTAERFVPDPFSGAPGARLYRTGDRCRFRRDGRLEFGGRLDSQIKLRGFRIELGEIESRLVAHPDIRQAAVVLREDVPGMKQLVAYLVTAGVGLPADLAEWLLMALPAHMNPSAFVQLDSLPTTTSGKLDQRKLPRPLASDQDESGEPTTDSERKLCVIVKDLLGLPAVSIHDRFFALGGDSISSVQLVARARREGLSFGVRDVFDAPNLAALALRARFAAPTSEVDEPAPSTAPLTPIQRWFFEQKLENPAHFNQSLWLEVDPRLDDVRLETALGKLVEHHASLRTCFSEGTQSVVAPGDLPEWFSTRKGNDLEGIANEAQLALDLEKGSVFRATLVAEPSGRRLLFLVAHHLVVDGVSWRILADDLVEIANALVTGAALNLDTSSISFLGWAKRALCTEEQLPEDELSHWRGVLAILGPALPRDRANGRNDYASLRSVTASLSPESSHELLRGALLAHRIEPGEVLLAALVDVLSHWTRSRRVRLDVERHGRDAHGVEVDTTRTVGWFTSLFPFALQLPAAEAGVEELLLAVKRQWRSVPRSGAGYGMLRYGARSAELADQPRAEIVFNYLGQVASEATSASTFFSLAQEPAGKHADPRSLRPYLLDVSALFVAGQLRLTLGFSEAVHDERTIEALANELVRSVEELTRTCGQPDAGRLHAQDFPAYRGDQRSLDLLGERLRARARDEGKDARRQFENIEDIYALSPLQAGMLFDTLNAPSSGMYVEQIVLELRGELDQAALERAFQDLVNRHAILRTRFEWEGFDEPVQIVQRSATIRMDCAGSAAQYVLDDREMGFDLSNGPLARVALFREGPRDFVLVVTHHHILLDGWSTGRAIAELMRFYEARLQGRSLALPAPLRFRDYVSWIQNRDTERDAAHWREVLEGVDEPTRLACDRGPSAGTGGVARRSLELPLELSAAIRALGRSESVTESALVHAAWALVLGVHSGSGDVVFGTVVSGRPAELPEVESAVGLFLNTVPLRVRIDTNLTVRELLRRVQAHMRDIQEHAHFPLSRLRALSSMPKNAAPFETAVAFESYPAAATFSAANLQTVAVRRQEEASVPLALLATPGERMSLVGQFSPGRFDATDVEVLLEQVGRCLEWITRDLDAKVSELSLLDPETRARIAQVSVGPLATERRTLHGMVEETARAHPNLPALVWTGGSLDYAELDERSKRLARHLVSLGVKPESRVAIGIERSADYVLAALAVLRAGGAFIPIDPAQPEERRRFLLEDSGAALLIDRSLVTRAQEHSGVRLPAVRPEQAAYVIYTSGSTGRPKGVVIEHRGVTNTLRALGPTWALEPGMRSTFIASTSFDSSLIEMFVPLTSGAALYVPTADERRPGSDLARYLEQNAIDLTLIVPSMLGAMPHELSVRTLVTGGEASTPALLAPFLRRQNVLNVYGPTEVSVVSAAGPIHLDDDVTLGTPLAGTDAWVLDESMRLVPIGVFGELYVGGAGLARSYLDRPELTAERFVPHPYASEPGARLYRTGDRCRYRTDGRLDFGGRLDTQVKLRGFRIELQEIEAALEAEVTVRRAVVVVREDVPGVERLVAYVDLVGGSLDRDALLSRLALRLPAHMLPSAFVQVDTLPLNASGKVDRKKLPAPPLERETEDPKPRTAAEQAVATLFEELLGVRDVRLADDFFALGGHSLLATRFVARLRRSLGVELPLKSLFDAPTVDGIAANVGRLQNQGITDVAIERTGQRDSLPLSFAQERIWFLQQLAPSSPAYNVPAVVRVRGPLDTGTLARGLERLVERHEILRTTYSDASGTPRARVHDTTTVNLRISTIATEGELALAIEQETLQPFDLTHDLPLRALLVRRSDDEHVICLTLHHIACDGWSAEILITELTRLYAGAELVELPIQYADYARWQRANEASFDRELEYWVERLGPDPEPLHLPLDRPRPSRQSYVGASVRRRLESDLSTRIHALARRSNATLFSLLLAGLTALLARASGDRRIIIGSPVANRVRPEAEQLIGVFLNTLAIVCEVDDDPTFHALVARAKDGVLGALAHQEVPFERVLEAIRPTRDPSRTPVFQVMLNIAPTALVTSSLGGLELTPMAVEDVSAKFDLTLYVSESEDGLSIRAVYASDLFDEKSVCQLLSSLESLLEQVTEKPDLRVSELQLDLPEGGYEAAAVEHFRRMFRAFTGATRLGPRRGQLIAVDGGVSFQGSPSHAYAAWALVLSRHTDADDAPFAIASSGGLFPFRVSVDETRSVRSFLDHVGDLLGLARRFAALRPDIDGIRLFDSVVCEEGAAPPDDADVSLIGHVRGRELHLTYDTDRFSEAQARELLEQWALATSEMTRAPHVPLSEVSLVTDMARQSLPDPRVQLDRVVYPSVATRIGQRARENPAAIAVRQGDKRFTYGELSRAARGVSVRLAESGVASGDVIGIAGRECFGRVVALVGALDHGAIVVPLDENLPPIRRERMLEEARAKLVLTLDDAEALSLGELDRPDGAPLPPDSPAYVFFTSGTTGTPKGVLGRHNGLAHFLDWQSREFGVGTSDRTGQLTSFSFDVVLRAILLPLVSGATLCLPDAPDVRVLEWLKREKVSLLHLVPTLAEAWLADAQPGLLLPDMRVLFFAGEPLAASLVARYRKLCPNAEIVNLYGPTETTLAKCFARVPVPASFGAQSVGRAMPGAQALVLDGSRLCGIGEPGDVVIRTPHRSLGYLNSPEENQTKFVPNPFGTDPDDLVYLTGDRGSYLPDGSLQLLGRSDDQTKLWGVRIEPQEIGSALAEHPLVQSAFVTLYEGAGGPRLVAYVVTRRHVEASALATHVSQRLPAAVVPSAFVFLPALPVGSNGKIDRSRLPEPELTTSYEAPRTHAEETIVRVWQEVLAVERVGIRDGFFALGGHSLLAARAVARIRELLGIELPVRALFEHATAEALARHIGEQRLSELDETELGALLDAIEGES